MTDFCVDAKVNRIRFELIKFFKLIRFNECAGKRKLSGTNQCQKCFIVACSNDETFSILHE